MSSEDKEEVFILEKAEISVDDDEGYNYDEIKDSDEEDASLKKLDFSDDDDLDDFEKLKAKAALRKLEKQSATVAGTAVATQLDKTKYRHEPKPKLLKRDVVIDDFIRNYLSKFQMSKTFNIFQQEWSELQKKGTFNDNHIGLITDTENKNRRMADRIAKMKVELQKEQVKADKAKSTWEKLRKERDFHKTHKERVENEKITISDNIKKLQGLQEQYEDKIQELTKKYEMTLKEKMLLKLKREKLRKQAQEARRKMREQEEEVAHAIEESRARMVGTNKPKQNIKVKGKNTPYPEEDARPNPFLAQEYDEINSKVSNQKIVKAHDKAIGGMCLHFNKQILATVSDDCLWKIWNMEDGENILSGEGHKDWITGVDFHPAGSHLVTSGGDKSIKIWDFVNS